MPIAQSWLGGVTASFLSRYGKALWPGAGFDVLGLRYRAWMPIRFMLVATCSRPAVKPSWRERPFIIRLPAKGIVHVQLVDPAHELEVVFADRAWFAINAVPADPEQTCLTGKAQLF